MLCHHLKKEKGMDQRKAIFSLEFQVRDYECDLQATVNNAIYLHYLEHTRHEFLKKAGFNFARMHIVGLAHKPTKLYKIEFACFYLKLHL
jgi:acyl-CoA thioesterase FadM